MALTRKLLKAMGIEDEKVEQIISAHSETVDALKEERDSFRDKADKADGFEKALNEANEKLKKADSDGSADKYAKLKQEFDDYKAKEELQKTNLAKAKAYENLLKNIGIGDKQIGKIVKLKNLSEISLDKDGAIVDVDKLKASETEEWKDFIVHVDVRGKDEPPKKPDGNQETDVEKMTMDEYVEARKKGVIK